MKMNTQRPSRISNIIENYSIKDIHQSILHSSSLIDAATYLGVSPYRLNARISSYHYNGYQLNYNRLKSISTYDASWYLLVQDHERSRNNNSDTTLSTNPVVSATELDFLNAIKNKNVSVVAQLINQYPYLINSKLPRYGKLIHFAADIGNLELLNLIIAYKEVDINEVSRFGNTSLMIAMQKGHTDIALTLMNDKRINVNKQKSLSKYTALDVALFEQEGSANYNFPLIKALLEPKELNVNQSDILGETTLHRLLKSNFNVEDKIAILKMLIDKGADAKAAFLHFNQRNNDLIQCQKTAHLFDQSYVTTEDLTRSAEIIRILQEVILDPFKDKGSMAQLTTILELNYFDEIEKGLSNQEKLARYYEILNLVDLSHHPEESRTLCDFLSGKGKALSKQGYLVHAYQEEINTEFDAIRHALIRQQTFSNDTKERYIPPQILMFGFKRAIQNRIQQLQQEQENAARIIQRKVRMHRFLTHANKLMDEQKQIKTFITQYEQTKSKINTNDQSQKQREKFVDEKHEKYKIAVREGIKIQTAINGLLKFFKQDSSVKVNEAVKSMNKLRMDIDSSEKYRNYFDKR